MAETNRVVIRIVERLAEFASKGARAAKAAKKTIGDGPAAVEHLHDADTAVTASETCLAQLRRAGVI